MKEIVKNAVLGIVSLSFEPKSLWKLNYNGITVTSRLDDLNLMEQIDKGLSLSKGDSIKADIEIEKHLGKDGLFYENKKYRIVRFIELIRNAKTQNFDF